MTFSAEKNQLSGLLPPGSESEASRIDSAFQQSIFREDSTRDWHCSMLRLLSLSNNMLTGPIPEELCNAGSLAEIDLDSNFLSGTMTTRLSSART
ncbi:hypothetical protein DVH24_022579 [Malus domestica]|uniref:Leucine-rich repeat-containing N-terminal plant-type domain-containing protein n=1 Tax=Malus domestica TaxID=3750 RepID=A0A498KRV8_MALDO|nr:hypothetical protein DVH24_022579 [Malus domestica]